MIRSEKARATWRIECIEPWRFRWNRDEPWPTEKRARTGGCERADGHALAEPGAHCGIFADGVCGVVEVEHLREHGRARPGKRLCHAAHAPGAPRMKLGIKR